MEQQTPSTTEVTTLTVAVPFISGESQSDVLEGELVFNPADPYAVSMNLVAKSGLVTWTFARELLAEGIFDPIGDGDVQVWPCLSGAGEAVVVIELSSPNGTAMLQTSSRTVHDFVTASYAMVPAGEESNHLSMDDLVARLLAA